MYCSQLLDIKKISNEQAYMLDDFLKNNLKNDYVSISACFQQTQIPIEILAEVFSQLCMIGFLQLVYAIRCPECGHLIKRFDEKTDVIKALNEITNCYLCDEEIEFEKSDIVALFKRNEKSPFFKGQRQKLAVGENACGVAHEDRVGYLVKYSETFSDFLELTKGEYISRQEESRRVAEVRRRAYRIYKNKEKKYKKVKIISVFISFMFLLILLVITKAGGTLSVLMNCFTYISQNIIDKVLDICLKPDIGQLESEQLYLMTNAM